MKFDIYNTQLSNAVKQRNMLLMVAAFLLISNLLLAFGFVTQDRQVVIVPAHIDQKIKYSNRYVDQRYLEVMTGYFTGLLLDKTAANAKQKSHALLQHVASSSYQKIANHLNEDAERYQNLSLTTSFAISDMIINPDKLTAELNGKLYSRYGKDGKSENPAHYLVKYEFKGGRLLLKEFSIVKEKK